MNFAGLLDNDSKTYNMMEDQIKQMMNAMESMQTRLVMTEKALVEARAGTTPPQKMAPLVDTRSIGKAPSFSGEHKDWHDWELPAHGVHGLCERQSHRCAEGR